MMRIKDYTDHHCDLRAESHSCLPELPPQTGKYRRTLHSLRKWFTISKVNQRTKQFFRSTAAIIFERKRQIYTVPFCIIHPFSKFCIYVEILMCFIWSYGYITDPLFIAFHDGVSSFISPLELVNLVVNIVQLVHAAMCFVTGFQITKTKEVVLAPNKIVWHYLTTYFFVDIFGSIPFRYIMTVCDANVDEVFFNLVHCTHLLRFFRIGTALHYSRQITLLLKIDDHSHVLIIMVLLTFFFVHWWACLVYSVNKIMFYVDGSIGSYSWLRQAGISDAQESHWLRKYILCLHTVMCNFYRAGIGMFITYALNEHVILSLVTISGSIYYVYSLVVTLQLVRSSNASESKYEEFLYQLNDYMRAKKLPLELRYRMILYYEHRFQKKFFREEAILSTLSDHLRHEIFIQSCKHLLKTVAMFKELPKQVVGTILGALKQEFYLPNDVIIKADSDSNSMYFISYGTVAVFNINGRECKHLSDGQHFGSGNLQIKNIEQVRYICTAIEMTECYRWDRSDFIKCASVYKPIIDVVDRLKLITYSTLQDVDNDIGQSTKHDVLYELRHNRILDTGIPRT